MTGISTKNQIEDFQIKASAVEIFSIAHESSLNQQLRSFNLKILLTVILLIAGSLAIIYAQPKHTKAKVKTARAHLQPVTLVFGQPTSWVNNENFVYNGFFLQSATDRILIKFPSYMGTKIRAAVRIGVIVNVSGVVTTNLIGDKEMKLVKLITDKVVLYDVKPSVKKIKKNIEVIKNDGIVSTIQTDTSGKIRGFYLKSMTILRVPITIGEQLRNILKEGDSISYTGTKRIVLDGEASSNLYEIIICKTITVNGKEYLVSK